MSDSLEIKDLLKAELTFGHQTHKWNPKNEAIRVWGEKWYLYYGPFKNNSLAKKAYDFIKKTSSEGSQFFSLEQKDKHLKL